MLRAAVWRPTNGRCWAARQVCIAAGAAGGMDGVPVILGVGGDGRERGRPPERPQRRHQATAARPQHDPFKAAPGQLLQRPTGTRSLDSDRTSAPRPGPLECLRRAAQQAPAPLHGLPMLPMSSH